MGRSEATVRRIFAEVGVTVDGPERHDPHVLDPPFDRRVQADGSLGLGESYLEACRGLPVEIRVQDYRDPDQGF